MPKRTVSPPDTRVLVETIREQLSELLTPLNALDVARTSFANRSDLIRGLAAALPARPGSKAAQNPKLHLANTRRNVNRYFATPGKEQRKPSEETSKALAEALRNNPEAYKAALYRFASEHHTLQIAIEGEVTISEDTRERRLPTRGAVILQGDDARNFLEAGINGDSQRAYELFFEGYHCTPGMVAHPKVELSIQ